MALLWTSTHIIAAFIAILHPRPLRRPFIFWFYGFFSRVLLKKIFGLQIEYLISDTPLPKQAVYICNHQSYFDIPLICTKVQISPIMKAELMRFPGIGQTSLLAGAITVSRKNSEDRKRVLREVMERLEIGDSIFFFPEGTRSKDGKPYPFEKIRTPIIKSAFDKGIPVVPLSLVNSHSIIDHYLKINRKKRLGFSIGVPLFPKDFPDRDIFAHAAWDRVTENYNRLLKLTKS